jgi:hypothetical protein
MMRTRLFKKAVLALITLAFLATMPGCWWGHDHDHDHDDHDHHIDHHDDHY